MEKGKEHCWNCALRAIVGFVALMSMAEVVWAGAIPPPPAFSNPLPSSSPAFNASATLVNILNGATTGDTTTVKNALNLESAAQQKTDLQKAAPVANASLSAPAIAAASASVGLAENRLASLRGDTSLAAAGTTGLSAGDAEKGGNVWIKGLGNWSHQGAKDGFDGYKTRTYGLGVGADTRLASAWTVGLGFTYGDTKIDQQDFRAGDTNKIRSAQLTGYAGREFGDAYFNAMLAYTDLNFDTSRATALSRTATGSFDGNSWTTKVGGGYKVGMGGGTAFVPMASLQYSSLTQKAYTESGAGALNLSYNGTDTTRTQSSLGARLVNDSRTGSGGNFKLEGRLAWLHDFRDAGTDFTTAYTGGGAAFTTNGQKIAKNGYNLGAGASYDYGKRTSVVLQYDHEGRSGYSSDSVYLVGRWMF